MDLPVWVDRIDVTPNIGLLDFEGEFRWGPSRRPRHYCTGGQLKNEPDFGIGLGVKKAAPWFLTSGVLGRFGPTQHQETGFSELLFAAALKPAGTFFASARLDYKTIVFTFFSLPYVFVTLGNASTLGVATK